MGLGVQGEDVEDQPAAVDDLDVEQALEALLLGRAELVVGDEDVEPGLATSPGASSSALPLPTYQLGSTWRRFCHSAPTTSAPAVVASAASSVRLSSAVQPCVVAGVDGDEEGLLDGRGEVDRLSGAHGGSRIPGRLRGPARRRAASRNRSSALDAAGVRASPARRGRRGPARAGTRCAGASRTARCAARRASIAASRRQRAVEHRPALAVADRRERAAGAGSHRSRRARASSTRPASNWARARAAIRRRCSRRLRRRAAARGRAPGSRRGAGQRRVAPERGDLEGPDDAPRVARGPCARRAPGPSSTSRAASGVEAVALEVAPRAPPGPPGPTAARRCRGRP